MRHRDVPGGWNRGNKRAGWRYKTVYQRQMGCVYKVGWIFGLGGGHEALQQRSSELGICVNTVGEGGAQGCELVFVPTKSRMLELID
jgi:hypothetical protein